VQPVHHRHNLFVQLVEVNVFQRRTTLLGYGVLSYEVDGALSPGSGGGGIEAKDCGNAVPTLAAETCYQSALGNGYATTVEHESIGHLNEVSSSPIVLYGDDDASLVHRSTSVVCLNGDHLHHVRVASCLSCLSYPSYRP
jgi:hypothetical protein